MKTLGLLKQKGGAGATTIAIHLAVSAQKARQRVLIIDTDPQNSALQWSRAREGAPPLVVAADAHELPQVLEAAQADGIDLVIIDTPPHALAPAATAARHADLALVPTRPWALDLGAIAPTLKILEGTGTPALLVLNACPARAPEVEEARALLETYGHPVWKGTIGDRTAFRRSLASGRAVTEADGRSTAAREIQSLWRAVSRELDRKRSR